MNLREYIDELKLRMMRIEVAVNFDDLTLASAINSARKTILLQTLDIYPNLFISDAIFVFSPTENFDPLYFNVVNYQGTTLNTYRFQMPSDFIKPVECWLTWKGVDGITEWKQIRIVGKKEFYSSIRHSFNTTHDTTLLGHFDQQITDGLVYFTFSLPQTIANDSNNSDFMLTVFYHYLPDDLELYTDIAKGDLVVPGTTIADSETVLPTFLEDLVVKQAMVDLLSTIDQANAYQRAKDELNISMQIIKFNKKIEYLRKRSLLPSKKTIDETNLPLISINIGGQENG